MNYFTRLGKIQILVACLAAIGAAFLTTLVDNGLGTGWTANVVRNWEQFGIFNLHGKMVTNPGGFEALTRPHIYPGHRPISLFPAYFVYHLFSAAGMGFVVYYSLITLIVIFSIWWLLGKTDWAFWLGAISVITPGYVRWQTTLDPNLTSVLFGFPFCAAVVSLLLHNQSLNWRQMIALAAMVLIYSAINWSTVLVHGMLFMTLLALPRIRKIHVITYAGFTAIAAGVVLLASLSSKMALRDGSSVGLKTMFESYGWGNAGYGIDLTTKTAVLRLVAANGIGLIPVLVLLAYYCLRPAPARSKITAFVALPLATVAVQLLGMRNYFGHHPWMSVSYTLLALVLAAVVWNETAAKLSMAQLSFGTGLACLSVVFAYTYIVQLAGYSHTRRELALVSLVQEHTSRDTMIVICRETDAELANIADRLPELFDRQLMIFDSAPNSTELQRQHVFVTSVPVSDAIARTGPAQRVPPMLKSLLDWYSVHIANRRSGDKLEVGDQYSLSAAAPRP